MSEPELAGVLIAAILLVSVACYIEYRRLIH
jgi:hypothetical protein